MSSKHTVATISFGELNLNGEKSNYDENKAYGSCSRLLRQSPLLKIVSTRTSTREEDNLNSQALFHTYSSASTKAPLSPSSKSTSGSSKVTIDNFELIRVVGKGSFGKVLLVRKHTSEKLYAIKVLRKREVVQRKQVEHTLTERRILEQIDHPYIVKLHYAFQVS